ncbi:M56 family metallopeptidase [Phenylobacterium sp.]|jgi:beta-lactamase regulating signal transducer with metallopeptidase domain|uniref:M56 family metallopeptidase n=1 Tax=Phenylobacterium sp. TaxID=1871053 RepID=UPI002F3EF965
MREALALVLWLNLAAGCAVAAVMLLRAPVRRLFGSSIAYGLWLLVPLAAAAVLIPARVIVLPAPPSPDIAPFDAPAIVAPAPAPLAPATADLPPILAGLWLAGLALSLAWIWRSQARFQHAVRQGRAGPAVVGVLRPCVVTPDDFARAYTPAEQRVVLAHEETHIARQDSRINAAVALARCLVWFNPLIHLMARAVRIDQEFACDAAVVARYPRARRAYAQALLKAGLAAQPLPFGCHWAMTHPLVARVDQLTRSRGDAMTRAAGMVAVAALAFGGAAAVWMARPARLAFAPSHEAVILAQAIRGAPPFPARAKPAHAEAAQAPRLTPIPLIQAPTPARIELAASPLEADFASNPSEPPHPERRVRGTAALSSVAPGTAVRVRATMVDDAGRRLTTDLTTFGSQSLYRMGYVDRGGSDLKLFTRVIQYGERYEVTAALNASFRTPISGSIKLAAGETGIIRLPQGLDVAVRLSVRPETPQEADATLTLGGRHFLSVERVEGAI